MCLQHFLVCNSVSVCALMLFGGQHDICIVTCKNAAPIFKCC